MNPFRIVLLFFCFSVFLFFVAPPTASATIINISPSPIPGETINIKADIDKNKNIKGSIGPQPDKLLFPNVSKPLDFLSDPDIAKKALPSGLSANFPEEEKTPLLKGKLAHVICGDVKVAGKERTIDPNTGEEIIKEIPVVDKDAYAASKPVGFEATKDWGKLILHSRFVQSFLVPGNGSDLTFQFNTPAEPNVPTRLADCPGDPTGESSKTIGTKNDQPQSFNPLTGFIGSIKNFFDNIFAKLFGTQIETAVKQIKYLEGETQLANQTVGESGLLNSFLPSTMLKDADQVEKVPYQVPGKGEQQVEVNYSQTKALDQRTTDVIKSLYPAVLASTIGPGDTAPPPITPGLTYTIPYRDTSISISPERRERIMKEVIAWRQETRIRELWDRVESEALKAKINPAFMLAIWIEESAASDRQTERENPGGYSAFGCFPGGNTQQVVLFERSLSCFIGFTQNHPNDFSEWARYFCGPQVTPICSNNPNFLTNLKDWYDRIAN